MGNSITEEDKQSIKEDTHCMGICHRVKNQDSKQLIWDENKKQPLPYALPIIKNQYQHPNIKAMLQKIQTQLQQEKLQQPQDFDHEEIQYDQKYWKKHNPIQIIIQGHWKKRLPHGQSKIFFPNGNILILYFKEGIPILDDCLLVFPNLDYYRGSVKNFKFQGKGKFVSQVFLYSGEWKNDLPHGNGVQKYPQQNVEYRGEFKNGQKHGQGVYEVKQPSGSSILRYQGKFQNNYFSGQGTIRTYDKKYLLEGQFQKEEIVIKALSTEKYKFQGTIDRDFSTGQGKIKCTEGSQLVYYGKLQDGKLNGTGYVQQGKNKETVYWFNGKKLKFMRNFQTQQAQTLLKLIQEDWKKSQRYSQLQQRLSGKLRLKTSLQSQQQKILKVFPTLNSKTQQIQFIVQIMKGPKFSQKLKQMQNQAHIDTNNMSLLSSSNTQSQNTKIRLGNQIKKQLIIELNKQKQIYLYVALAQKKMSRK